MRLANRFGALLLPLGIAALASSPLAAEEGSSVDRYDVVWTSPSRDASGSMPLGNGDVSLNAWLEESGDLIFYIGKTDSWGDNGRLLKVGRVRVSLSPGLLEGGARLTQILCLETGEIVAEATAPSAEGADPARTRLRLWVDAHHPAIQVAVESSRPLAATATIEPWRTEREELPSIEVSDVLLDRSRPGGQRASTIVEPDTILDDPRPRIGWYHHNRKSIGPELTMRIQGLAGCLEVDPLLHRTFGAVVTAEGGGKADRMTLKTHRGTSQRISVHVLTRHPSSPEEWLAAMDSRIAETEKRPFEARRRAHEEWWEEFWSRSWIHIRERDPRPPAMIEPNNHSVRLGVDQAGGSRFRGELGRVSLLGRALSEEEISRLAGGGREALSDAEGLVASLRDVEPGSSLPEGASVDLGGPLTLEAWVRPEALAAGGGRIVDKITPGGSDGFLLDTWPGNSLRLIVAAGTLAKRDCLIPGEWHHVAATVDPAAGTLALYLGGAKVAEERAEVLADSFIVSRGYALQRFINACAGRGRFPIKFNGSIFTVPSPGAPGPAPSAPGDADYRRWGPGYWWQNTRLPYVSMCTSGDFDLMQPLFRMYAGDVLEISKIRTRRYFGHGGAFFPECIYFWGAVFSETYGWTPFEEREDKLQESGWHKWEWVAGPELAWMMLDYYDHTGDEAFLSDCVLPAAREVLAFFEEHYEVDDRGKLIMHPAQAVETWWDCTNPMPELAGLIAVTERLLGLPERLTPSGDRDAWRHLRAKLPDLPLREVDGAKMLAPAERFADKRNIENPELYAVFPFRLVAVGRPDIELGRRALEHRWDRGDSGWRQDDVFMAYLGLPEDARKNVVSRARKYDRGSRFPAFWGPNYDWVPDQDHGGILLKAVQAMLLQTDGDAIYLLPAWPEGWEASFKLHAPRRTIVEGEIRGGRVVNLKVEPEERRKDVRILR